MWYFNLFNARSGKKLKTWQIVILNLVNIWIPKFLSKLFWLAVILITAGILWRLLIAVWSPILK